MGSKRKHKTQNTILPIFIFNDYQELIDLV